MRVTIIILFLGLFINSSRAQNCDIAQAGVVVFNSSNSNPVTTILIGQTANFRFSIKNAGNNTSCAIPANSVTAVFDFPTMEGGIRPYVYAGPPNYVSGYFTWTYNSAAEVLVGTNTREIPAGTTDLNITMRVRGNAAGAGNSNLNITQGKGVADNVANNFSGARLVVAGGAVPSIDLKSFTAIGVRCDVLLKWSTASNDDQSNFEVEYSPDGFSFSKIGMVAGKNSSTGADYEFSYTPPDAKGYYMLKKTEPDGHIAYSNDLFATTACPVKGKITVYPNPVSFEQKLVVNITGYTGSISAELFDAAGKKVQGYSLANTLNELSVKNLAAGTYLLNVRVEKEGMQSFKIIVTR